MGEHVSWYHIIKLSWFCCYFLYFLGDLESGPVFLSHSLDECIYEFEWYTASACTLSHSTGDNCRVFDQVAGRCNTTKEFSIAFYVK
jgi:hypothetical protein